MQKRKSINNQKNYINNSNYNNENNIIININNNDQTSGALTSRTRNLKTYNIFFKTNSIDIDKNKLFDMNINKENFNANKRPNDYIINITLIFIILKIFNLLDKHNFYHYFFLIRFLFPLYIFFIPFGINILLSFEAFSILFFNIVILFIFYNISITFIKFMISIIHQYIIIN